VFLHPLGSVGHVAHSGASRAQNGDVVFFMLGWHRHGFDKKALGHVVHLGAFKAQNGDTLFFMLM
jgi:NADPH-dependent curcumin reductase CurA